jgi:hypothetical protein
MPATGTWTATTNATWLHLSSANQSGTGSTNVVFSYDANPGATRSGTLTVGGQTLTVTQAGATYVAAGTVTTLVSSDLNEPFGVAVDGTGNVYIADTGNGAIKEWMAANNTVTTLVSGLLSPYGGGRRGECLCRRYRCQQDRGVVAGQQFADYSYSCWKWNEFSRGRGGGCCRQRIFCQQLKRHNQKVDGGQ